MRTGSARRVRGVTVRVACAQIAARPFAQAADALRDILAAIGKAKRLGADLVVLPECSYPGYVLLDADPYRRRIPSDADALRAIFGAAARNAIDVCIGIARRGHDGILRNEAVYVDESGAERGSYAKCRLWNFDQRWFAPGHALPVVMTRFGPIGMMICADGRNPEIARTLVAKGARMLLVPTAWVGSGPSHEAVRNPQADYVLRARAAENGVWIAAADKCGSELGVVHYAGRSQIVDPFGSIAALAGSSKPEMIVAAVRPAPPRPFVTVVSRPDLQTLRAPPRARRTPTRTPPRIWLGLYQSAPRRRDDPLALQAIWAQSVSALICSGSSRAATRRALDGIAGVRCAVFEGEELLAPEPARAAALRGADLLVWMRPPNKVLLLDLARTRALENRTYVALCTLADQSVGACLIGPDGTPTGSALAGIPSGFVAVVDTALARRKEVVPGTQTFADRMPRVYRWLSADPRSRKARER